MSYLEPNSIRERLTTTLLGRRIEVHERVGSTNDLVRQAARQGEKEGLVVLAEEQTTGRGRLGRVWTAPYGCCILCSVLLRPRFSPEHAFHLTMAGSLAIYRGLARMISEEVEGGPQIATSTLAIKWPNDVLLNGRKVSGALCESEWSGGEWLFAVLGFGINVNLEESELGELRDTATSLLSVLGREVARERVLALVLEELEGLYLLLQSGRMGVVRDAWAERLETVGRQVTVREPGGTIEGRAVRVDADGALVLRTAGGERRVFAGDVVPL